MPFGATTHVPPWAIASLMAPWVVMMCDPLGSPQCVPALGRCCVHQPLGHRSCQPLGDVTSANPWVMLRAPVLWATSHVPCRQHYKCQPCRLHHVLPMGDARSANPIGCIVRSLRVVLRVLALWATSCAPYKWHYECQPCGLCRALPAGGATSANPAGYAMRSLQAML